ncbi:LytTR family transcriptional regulator [Methylovirgula ligni]|uniref:NO-binding membrane sensor protein with MHYT domain n=1 Tax=Methylovirgula ligni TaxID=569860 RepID=A0A3D9Z1U4_9HYPH|nr:MHYT domain-containing protein [Methylovirgula ligni]QAY95520.1 LytTR family transcriptional regulator [Methylovirgula ligni]REF89143.1 NO-binding membrane sensor protein with MHYT domain [Methylovirgula ligni]
MHISHDPLIVVLSVIVAIQGAYVGLGLALQSRLAAGTRQRTLLAASSITLGVAIWSMHFIGMLAARLSFPVDYLVFPTLLSFLVSVLVTGIGVFAATAGPLTGRRLAASAMFMGLGIASMHYIGMTALHASAHMVHDPLLVIASILIAIAASGLALHLAAGTQPRQPLFLSAIVFGIAVSGMHYSAMAGMRIFPHALPTALAPALSPDLLAIVVAVVAFIVSGLFLLVLVPDRRMLQKESRAGIEPPAVAPEPSPIPECAAEAAPDVTPLAAPLAAPETAQSPFLPVERDRGTYFLPIGDIAAVRANAHYTYVFDGQTNYFCALSIGEVEARLRSHHFVRVHRSHIVNMDRVVALKSVGDACQIELAGVDPYFVPVSRSRAAWLKSKLGLKSRQAAG